MVSKCANPECSEQFRFLHQGKLFLLTPTPNLQTYGGDPLPFLYERFWLCDSCSKKMTLIWGGKGPRLIPIPDKLVKADIADHKPAIAKHSLRKRAARVGMESG